MLWKVVIEGAVKRFLLRAEERFHRLELKNDSTASSCSCESRAANRAKAVTPR